jgi:pimeloyl-ACP methyl ester carboxylesterase
MAESTSPPIELVSMDGLTLFRAKPLVESAPPMLFVHGYFVDGRVFERLMAHFVARGHACYAVNLRGRAGSRTGVALGRVSMREFADDAAELAASLDRPILVGHSMGGLVSQLVAERGLVRALVLLAPAPPRGIRLLTPRLALAQIPYLPVTLLSKVVRAHAGLLTSIAFNCVPPEQRRELLAQIVPDSGLAAREMSLTGVSVDAGKLRLPMLVIGGDQDRFIPLSVVTKVAARYGAPLRVAPGRGHMLLLEPGWEEIAGWIDQWLITNHIPH